MTDLTPEQREAMEAAWDRLASKPTKTLSAHTRNEIAEEMFAAGLAAAERPANRTVPSISDERELAAVNAAYDVMLGEPGFKDGGPRRLTDDFDAAQEMAMAALHAYFEAERAEPSGAPGCGRRVQDATSGGCVRCLGHEGPCQGHTRYVAFPDERAAAAERPERRCPQCSGGGRVIDEDSGSGPDALRRTTTCPTCEGSGRAAAAEQPREAADGPIEVRCDAPDCTGGASAAAVSPSDDAAQGSCVGGASPVQSNGRDG